MFKTPQFLQAFFPADGLWDMRTLLGVATGQIPPQFLTADNFLDSAEVKTVQDTLQQFNAVIAELCAKYDVHLIDSYSLIQDMRDEGITVAGQKLTGEYFGGLYSWDGAHPSFTGYAIVANHVIESINKRFGLKIKAIDLERVFNRDPYQPTGRTLF